MIEIINYTKNKINKNCLIKNTQNFLAKKKIINFELAIHIVTSKKIRQLNKKFLRNDKTTDVLSFPQVNNLKDFDNNKLPIKSLGDIFICYEVCQKQAKQNNKTIEEELLFLVKHGLKHLIGKHHK